MTMWIASFGDFRQNGIKRLDDHVHGECTCDCGKSHSEPGERMPANAQEGGAGQRDQHHIAGVCGNAGQDADERDDVNECPTRRDGHEFSDQRVDQAGFLGDADAHHGDDQQPNRGETHEVWHEPGVNMTNSIRRQQAIGGRGRGLDLVSIRVDDLIGDACPQHVE
ncbi:hypothetical protein AB7M70_009902 [Bradyrhizobium japonicum]